MLRLAFFQLGKGGGHFDALDRGVAVAEPGRTLLNPARWDPVRLGVFVQHFAALVPDGCGRLGDEQAACRCGELDAPAPVSRVML